jgi:hypothetical protein
LNRKLVTLTTLTLVIVVVLSLLLTVNLFSQQNQSREFYVGVEYAYGSQVSEVEALVDKVKNYTNLFVLGSPDLTFNRSALDESCDYIFNAKLNFIVLFTSLTVYHYDIFSWMQQAKQKYGNSLIGIYRFDEPGGNQLDQGSSLIFNVSSSYAAASKNYVGNISSIVNYYLNHAPINVFTADYALDWFDYKSNYTAVFAEFVGNESRQRIIALDRGAAEAFGKDWGVIINWKYDHPPYLESKDELYADLSLAYSAGAKYSIVFSYSSPNTTNYGTLTEDHFDALQTFWGNLHSNPASFGSNKPQVAYVVPADYGFGFRNPNDSIWGLFPADTLSAKIYSDIENLTQTYGSHIDILYDEPTQIAPLLKNYSQVFYWNQTVP